MDVEGPSTSTSLSPQIKLAQGTTQNAQKIESKDSVLTITKIKETESSSHSDSSISVTSDKDLNFPKCIDGNKTQNPSNNSAKQYYSVLENNGRFKRKSSLKSLSRRQFLTICIVGISDFVGAVLLSNQSPWFPIEAKEKGLNATSLGFVFGAFELAVFLASPIFQAKMRNDSITPQMLFHTGIFMTSTCGILFSFLGYVTTPDLFLALSILIRVIEGIGEAALLNGSFAVIAIEFKEFTASTLMSLETFFGLGIFAGPPLGGALWDWIKGERPERFMLTFGTFGAVLLGVAILGLFLLPRRNNDLHELEGNGSGIKIFSLLRVPYFPLISFTMLSSAMSLGFLYVTLSIHLLPFNLHPVLLGGIFLLNGGTAALSAPLFSMLIQKNSRPKYFMCFGAIFIAIGFCLIGPASYIPLEPSLWLASIGLFAQGIGLGLILPSTFKFSLDQAIKHGYANNPVTYGSISSFWAALFSLGAFFGSVFGGVLFDWVGFRASSWIIIDFQLVVIIFTLTSIIVSWIENHQRKHYNENGNYNPTPFDTESEPLLTSTFSSLHRNAKPSVLKKICSEPSFRTSSGKVKYGSTSELDS